MSLIYNGLQPVSEEAGMSATGFDTIRREIRGWKHDEYHDLLCIFSATEIFAWLSVSTEKAKRTAGYPRGQRAPDI